MPGVDERQDRVLAEHSERLREIDSRLPEVKSASSGGQRMRFAVPTPYTAVALGARGTEDTVGPRGVALTTTEHFAAAIAKNSIFDGTGNVIFHAGGQGQLLATGDAAISSNANLRVGTAQSIEITAGDAGFADPDYNGGDAEVPAPRDVDTAAPRASTELEEKGWKAVWRAMSIISSMKSVWSFRKGLTSGMSKGTLSARVEGALSLASSVETLFKAALDGLWAVGVGFDKDDEPSSAAASIKMHGAGGINMTTPAGISGYAGGGISFRSPDSVSLTSGWSASMKSAGSAGVYGGASASLKSQGVVGVQGKVVSMSGDLTEVKSEQTLLLSAGDFLKLESDRHLFMNSKGHAAVAGDEADLAALTAARVTGRSEVKILSDEKVEISSGGVFQAKAEEKAEVSSGDGRVVVTDKQVELAVGTKAVAVLTGRRFSIWGLDVESASTKLKGDVYLG